MLRCPPAGLLHVVDRDVLEEPGERVEAHAAVRIEIGEPDAPRARERPPPRGDGYPGIEHLAPSLSGHSRPLHESVARFPERAE